MRLPPPSPRPTKCRRRPRAYPALGAAALSTGSHAGHAGRGLLSAPPVGDVRAGRSGSAGQGRPRGLRPPGVTTGSGLGRHPEPRTIGAGSRRARVREDGGFGGVSRTPKGELMPLPGTRAQGPGTRTHRTSRTPLGMGGGHRGWHPTGRHAPAGGGARRALAGARVSGLVGTGGSSTQEKCRGPNAGAVAAGLESSTQCWDRLRLRAPPWKRSRTEERSAVPPGVRRSPRLSPWRLSPSPLRTEHPPPRGSSQRGAATRGRAWPCGRLCPESPAQPTGQALAVRG